MHSNEKQLPRLVSSCGPLLEIAQRLDMIFDLNWCYHSFICSFGCPHPDTALKASLVHITNVL